MRSRIACICMLRDSKRSFRASHSVRQPFKSMLEKLRLNQFPCSIPLDSLCHKYKVHALQDDPDEALYRVWNSRSIMGTYQFSIKCVQHHNLLWERGPICEGTYILCPIRIESQTGVFPVDEWEDKTPDFSLLIAALPRFLSAWHSWRVILKLSALAMGASYETEASFSSEFGFSWLKSVLCDRWRVRWVPVGYLSWALSLHPLVSWLLHGHDKPQ